MNFHDGFYENADIVEKSHISSTYHSKELSFSFTYGISLLIFRILYIQTKKWTHLDGDQFLIDHKWHSISSRDTDIIKLQIIR